MDEEKQEQELENIDTITVNIALVNLTKLRKIQQLINQKTAF